MGKPSRPDKYMVIYRKTNKLVVGDNTVADHIDVNEQVRQWGPQYAAIRVSDPPTFGPDELRKVVNGAVIKIPNTGQINKKKKLRKDKKDGTKKLEQLGLTKDQIRALTKSED